MAPVNGPSGIPATNLPLQLTSFIGREREIAEVKHLLSTTRLLTITGAGGCGKTRLALKVAEDLLEQYPDGAWFVDLAPLSDPSLVLQTVASVFDLRESGDLSLADLLKSHLRPRNLLLVLDNCEHLIDVCAQLSDALLSVCPNLKILATGREALNISGETTFRVPSLALPDPQQLPSIETLARYESIQLFVERARAARSDFQLNDANALASAQICQRLDGMPLAIELAAARVKALSVEQITARLDDRFRLLTTGSRTAPTRQQTLRAAIDWSYDLLSEKERVLFGRLAVFAGGFTLQAAEAICALDGIESHEVLGVLSGLVSRSFVVAETQRWREARYHLLETIREHALEKLQASGSLTETRTRHRDFYLAMAERFEMEWRGPKQLQLLDQMETENDNMRAALTWSMTELNGAETGLRIGWALWRFWELHSHISEGRDRLAKLLALSEAARPIIARAKVLNASGYLAARQADYQASDALLEQGLRLAQELEDKPSIVFSIYTRGMLARLRGDFARAESLLGQSLTVWREMGDRVGVYISLFNLALAAQEQGNFQRAIELHEESLALKREQADQWSIANSLQSLGLLLLAQGHHERAITFFKEGGSQSLAVGDRALCAGCLEGLASTAAILGKPERAARLFGATKAARESIHYPRSLNLQKLFEPFEAMTHAQLGETAFAAAWTEGRAMTMEQAIEYALQSAPVSDAPIQTSPPTFPAGLTEREVEVLRWLARGLTDQEIADRLVLSRRTVHAHLRSIYGKLDVTTRNGATRIAIENKIV